jgi:small subunit ribosomal protein S1
VREVDAKGATIDFADGIEGYLRANDIAKERVEDATQHFKVGDAVEAKFTGMDRKGRVLQLSIRAKEEADLQDPCWTSTRAPRAVRPSSVLCCVNR